jgi:hypothetical protein
MCDSDLYDHELISQLLPRALTRGQSDADLLSRLSERTSSLVAARRGVILLLADLLVSNVTLTGAEVRLWARAGAPILHMERGDPIDDARCQ